MSGSQDEIPPPPPPPPSSSQTPTQQTPQTVSTIKLPILKKGEYDIWAMKMEHYLAHTYYPIWEAREKERKQETTLLIGPTRRSILLNLQKMTDANDRCGSHQFKICGNDESKKMQKYILKQQFEGFSVSNTEGLHKGYDRIKGNQDNMRRDAWNSGTKDGSRTGKKEDSKALVTIDGEGVDWTNHSEEDEDYALMACNSSDSDTEIVEDEYVSIPTKEQETPSFANQQVKTPRKTVKNQFTHSQKPKVDKKEYG
ncbi:hypothetical protein Tco_0175193 [Tanacetum coccineum]